MADEATRNKERRDNLLSLLEQAEKEWGARQELIITREAEFFRKVLDKRLGSGASTSGITDQLSGLAATKISEFLTGSV